VDVGVQDKALLEDKRPLEDLLPPKRP
jgi:hypothetical protein